MKPFTDSRRIFWLAGIALLVLGFLTAALILPGSAGQTDAGPDIRVPKMQNVPPDESGKMKLDVEEDKESAR